MVRQVNKIQIEQFVMAYEAEQDRLRAMLPEDTVSLRPVLRINAEIRDERIGYLELNTPAEKNGNRGWMNIGFWENAAFRKDGKTTSFILPESISSNKEYCDCRFRWKIPGGAAGESTGKTLPAYPTEVKTVYPRQDLNVENAARIPCAQVLGTYVVCFERAAD